MIEDQYPTVLDSTHNLGAEIAHRGKLMSARMILTAVTGITIIMAAVSLVINCHMSTTSWLWRAFWILIGTVLTLVFASLYSLDWNSGQWMFFTHSTKSLLSIIMISHSTFLEGIHISQSMIATACFAVATSFSISLGIILYRAYIRNDASVGTLPRQLQLNNMVFFCACALLVAGSIHVNLVNAWPASILDPEHEAAKTLSYFSTMITNITATQFAVMLALTYSPYALLAHLAIRRIAHNAIPDADTQAINQWIDQHELTFSNKDRLLRVLGFSSPILGNALFSELPALLST
jgi:hypothetical protein